MIYPSFSEVEEICKQGDYGVVPITKELMADHTTPIEVLRILKNVSKHCYLLESMEENKKWGRYTFLGYDPVLELTCINHQICIKTGMTVEKHTVHPNEYIRGIIKEHKSPRMEGLPSFTGGLVGYFSYDYIKYSEPSLNLDAMDEEGFKDVDLMLFDKVIVFDHYKQKMILIVNMKTSSLKTNYNKAVNELSAMKELILNGKKEEANPLKLKTPFKALFTKNQYCEMVQKAKNYIKEGDIFQVVLSNRLEAKMEGSLLDAYRLLRTTNPSPYMFYFSSEDVEIVGASPETLVKLESRKLYTFPLAGTRKRGETLEEDLALERELLRDEKELAEHNMLVDLGRNDIGRISEIGSVKVENYMSVEKFSHVMHIGSTVTGIIKNEKDALDAVDSILPAGTLSGAPKIRACEIINELENNKRGIYGGAIGYIDFAGNLDTCIAIRLAFAKNGKVFVRSGAGIVADSVPESEYQECANKAQAVVNAIMNSEGGLHK